MSLTARVVDASVLVDALLAPAERGRAASDAISGYALAGPEHLQIETFHVIQRMVVGGLASEELGQRAVTRLGRLTVRTVPTSRLLERMWELRGNLTGYDAAYVAAAEQLQVDLLTRDGGIHNAPGLRCRLRRP